MSDRIGRMEPEDGSKVEEEGAPSRAYSTEYKVAAVRRMEAGESPSALGKELGVVRKVLYFWQRQVKAGQKMKVPGRPKAGVAVPPVSKGNQIAELKRLVGRQQLELSFFRGALPRVAALNPPPRAAGATPSLPKSGK